MVNEREIVLDMLLHLARQEGYSHQILAATLTKYQYLPKVSRSFLTRLYEGTLEYRYQIDWELDYYSSVQVKKMKPVIREIVRMGVYQILYMNQVPDSAACNEAVKLAVRRGFSSLKGFVNGLLRRICREKMNLARPDEERSPLQYLSWYYSMPEWIVKEWVRRFGRQQTECMLAAELMEHPVTVCSRVGKKPDEFCMRLRQEGVTVKPGNFLEPAFCIRDFDYLNRLDSFREGLFFVQDESSMLAVAASGVKSGDTVLDVCAAPGGKSLYLAQLTGKDGHVTARDLTEYKVELIRENAKRCQVENLIAERYDACIPDPAWRERADVVMADLPCSGLGVIGKKKDIKYRIRPEDLKELAHFQRKILSVVRDYVKPGGILLYSTCTISQAENEDNVAWMEQEWKDFSLEPLFCPELFKDASNKKLADRLLAEGEKGYVQLCPGVYPVDGFFMAKLRRNL